MAEQEKITESIYQISTVVREEKKQFTTTAAAAVTVINSEATATAIQIVTNSQAAAFARVITAKASKLSAIEGGLGLGTPGKLLTYMWYSSIGGDSSKTQVVVGSDGVSQAKLTSY